MYVFLFLVLLVFVVVFDDDDEGTNGDHMKCLWMGGEWGFTVRAGSICPHHQFAATSLCCHQMALAPAPN